ncbi:PqqD family protein [Sphingomonas canadensis]|uniref:PqqD family protein n=1 Tax=Sphingomonas canadensis TaxID=1219257 RepID=A0ABW3H933_9SPHN|nr:PqqD family protein [Sphingomonas canadensis]MCW3836913.1 PqqD family protein [Sphingomonas canadensis]
MTIDQMPIARNPSVMFSEVEQGTVLMNIESGTYFDLDPIGSAVWALLESPATLPELCAALVARYEVDSETCHADVSEFVKELIAVDVLRQG